MKDVVINLLIATVMVCAGVSGADNILADNKSEWASAILAPFDALKGVANIVSGTSDVGVLDALIDFFQPVALSLCLMYCVMTFFDNMAFREKEFTPVALCKEILRIVVGFAAITYSDKIASAILNANNWIANNFADALGEAKEGSSALKTIVDSIQTAVDGTSFWALIIIIILGAILLIVGIIGNLAVLSVYYSRKFELMLRCGFLPLALSEFYNDGMRSSGIRYIKKTAACAMTVAAYLACDYIAAGMMASAFETFGSGAFAVVSAGAICCMIKFVQVGAMSVAKNIMFESFGS